MNTDFIAFNINITIQETIELLRELKPDDEVVYYIYITDAEERLQGEVSLRDLIVSDPDVRLRDIMSESTIKVRVDEKLEETIELAMKYDLLSLPVVDEDDRLRGIVIIHDIIDDYFTSNKRRRNKKS